MADFSLLVFAATGGAPTTCQMVLNPVSGICKGLVRAASGGVATTAGAFLAMGTFKFLEGRLSQPHRVNPYKMQTLTRPRVYGVVDKQQTSACVRKSCK